MQRQKGTSQTATLPAIRMYPAELESVKKRAVAAGLKLSDYVRAILAEGQSVMLSVPPAIQHSPPPLPPLHSNPIVTTQQVSPLSSQTLSSQNVIPSTPKALHEPSFIEATVSRKVGHELGCSCIHCERIRTVLSTNKTGKAKAVRKR